MFGVDLSNHNEGFTSWAGVDFAWIKATEGVTYVDPFCDGFVQAAHARRIPWGTYHFAHPEAHPAAVEAAHYLAYAHVPAPLPAALDVEGRETATAYVDPLALMGAAALAQWVNAWCSIVGDATGAVPFTYLNRDYATALVPLLDQWPLWLATLDGTGPLAWEGRDVTVVQYAITQGIDRDQSLLPLPIRAPNGPPVPPPGDDPMFVFLAVGQSGPMLMCGGRIYPILDPADTPVLCAQCHQSAPMPISEATFKAWSA